MAPYFEGCSSGGGESAAIDRKVSPRAIECAFSFPFRPRWVWDHISESNRKFFCLSCNCVFKGAARDQVPTLANHHRCVCSSSFVFSSVRLKHVGSTFKFDLTKNCSRLPSAPKTSSSSTNKTQRSRSCLTTGRRRNSREHFDCAAYRHYNLATRVGPHRNGLPPRFRCRPPFSPLQLDTPLREFSSLLLHCLGPEGQRIFDALTPSPTTPQLSTTEPLTTDATATDTYDAAREILARHFAGARNIRLERHHFRERRQLHGESIPDFALALHELAASCDFAEQANDNMCDLFVTGIASPQLRSRLLLEGGTLTFDPREPSLSLKLLRTPLSASYASSHASMMIPDEARLIAAGTAARHDPFSEPPCLPHARQASSPSSDTDAASVPYSENAQVCGNCGRPHCEPTACPLAVEPASHAAAMVTLCEFVVAHAEHEDDAPLASKK
ncbi:hypothetical protein HPB52_021964 [Rhipicephalus sanguineus]|uniref:Tick transposon n=1 Tax=Rhipicephalus sanguineus TaxID=34632 RepID=A0A9D4Q8J4_RHISA|nr:hypothetical protein HPB52_021964 [Rhipicephalus sanguineus]